MHREQSRRRFLRGCCVAGAGTLAASGLANGATADEGSQAVPETRWGRTYTESAASMAEGIAPADDGGFVVVGTIESKGDDQKQDLWLAKLSAAGQVVWERTFTERAETEGFDVAAADDGFIVTGHTREEGAEAQDAIALRVDAKGVEQWRRTFHVRPGTADTMRAVDVDGDGRFIFAGWTSRFEDAWVAQLTDENKIQWTQRYGPGSRSRYHGVVADSDGGYVVVGETDDTSGNTVGWANKLGEDGTQQFSQQFKKQSDSSTNPYDDYNVFYDVAETRNGFVAVGANAFDPRTNDQRGWALEFNVNGGKLWDKRYTENNHTELRGVTYTNLEYYVVGETATDGSGTDARGYAANLGIDGAMKWSGTWSDGPAGFTGFHLTDENGVVAVGNAVPDGIARAWSVKIGGEAVATRTPSPTPTPTATPEGSNTPTFSPTPTDDGGTVVAGGGTGTGSPVPTEPAESAAETMSPGDGGSGTTTTAPGEGGISLVTIGIGAVILALGGGGVLYNRFLAGDDADVTGPGEGTGGAAPMDTGDGGDDGGDDPETTEPATDENQEVQSAQTVVEGEDGPDGADTSADDDSSADEPSSDE